MPRAKNQLPRASRLSAWQRELHALVTRPLDAALRHRDAPVAGKTPRQLARKLVKPSATLAPIERVNIYNRMYWSRVLDSLAEDLPGTRALLGERRFWRLAQAYLERHPSRTFTLRNLPAQLPRFIAAEPRYTQPHTEAALDLVRYEWAQVNAFDGASATPVSAEEFRRRAPHTLRFRLQPSATLLTSRFAVDEFWHALKRDGALRNTASQAVLRRKRRSLLRRSSTLRREKVHLVVHRFQNTIYTKRLTPAAARVLRALSRGRPLAEALALGAAAETPETVRAWFAEWMQLGWLNLR